MNDDRLIAARKSTKEQMVEELARFLNVPEPIEQEDRDDVEILMPLILRWLELARLEGRLEEALVYTVPHDYHVNDLKRQIAALEKRE